MSSYQYNKINSTSLNWRPCLKTYYQQCYELIRIYSEVHNDLCLKIDGLKNYYLFFGERSFLNAFSFWNSNIFPLSNTLIKQEYVYVLSSNKYCIGQPNMYHVKDGMQIWNTMNTCLYINITRRLRYFQWDGLKLLTQKCLFT